MELATQNLALSSIQAVGAPPRKEGKAWFLCMLSFSPPSFLKWCLLYPAFHHPTARATSHHSATSRVFDSRKAERAGHPGQDGQLEVHQADRWEKEGSRR